MPVYGETSTIPRAWSISATSSTTSPARGAKQAEQGATASEKPPSLGKVDLSMTLATAKVLPPVLFVPPSMPAVDLLVRMQATRTHMALVIDEYGGTDGLVSIEDLVEMVVGDIEDEHDVDERAHDPARRRHLRRRRSREPPRRSQASASTSRSVRWPRRSIRSAASSSSSPAACRPRRAIQGSGHLEFEVLDADPRRVKRVRIHRCAERADRRAAEAVVLPT